MSPLYHSLHYVPPREKECPRLIYIYLLLAYLSCYSVNQLTLFIGFYYHCPQSEVLLDKSRSALLECAIHVFNSVSLCPTFLL